MFGCKKCEALESEVTSLRKMFSLIQESNEKLTNQLVALTDKKAYAASAMTPLVEDEDFPDGPDEGLLSYNENGQTVVIKRQ